MLRGPMSGRNTRENTVKKGATIPKVVIPKLQSVRAESLRGLSE